MSKNHQSILAAQLEHQQAIKARRMRLDRIWTIVLLVVITGIIFAVVAIQTSHHW